METADVVQIITGSIALISLLINIYLIVKTTSKQLLHAANKDWFNTFTVLIGDLSSLHCKICAYRKSKPDDYFETKNEIRSMIRSKLTILCILVNKEDTRNKANKELFDLIKSYMKDVDSSEATELTNIIIKDLDKIIRKSIDIAEHAKRALYQTRLI